MKKSLLFLLVFFTVSAGVASAQNVETLEFKDSKREFNYGFISVTGGTTLFMGDYADERDFGSRLAPIMDASIGKMFNPYLGFRLQWTGWNMNSVSPGGTKWSGGLLESGSKFYKNDFNLNYTHVDLLWNLSNSLGGPKERRFWDFVPYVGVGWVNANKVNSSPENRLGVNAGLLQQFRLSPSVDIILDARAMGTNRNIDHVVKDDGKSFDMTASLTLGVAYNFGRAKVEAMVAPIDLSIYDNRISALERDLAASQARAAQLARDLEAEKAREKTVINNNIVAAQLAVWFEIGHANLSEKEKINLGYIADAIKKGSSDKVYTIYSSADKQTGSPVFNQRLSEQRAQAVYDELVKNGVNSSQLRLNPVGGVANPDAKFDKPLLNRVAIIGE